MKKFIAIITLSMLCIGITFGQNISVKGKVTSDVDRKAIPDVNIRLKGGITITKSDANGEFAIDVPERSSQTLVFSHPDYDELELFVGQEQQLDIVLTSNICYDQYGKRVDRQLVIPEERSGILVFESKDRDYKFWFDIRLQTDGAYFLGNTYNPIANGTEIRRARFAAKAELPGDFEAEIDLDFADGYADLKDVFLLWNAAKGLELKVGAFKERFSMEDNTSSRYLTFMERPTVIKALAPSRHLGFQVNYNMPYLLASGGIHFQDVGDYEVIANRKTLYQQGVNEGYSLTGKLVAMPFYYDINKGLHFGIAGSYRTPKTDIGRIDNVRFDSRPNININRLKYIDTDYINKVRYHTLGNFEFAAYYQGFKFVSEYIIASVNRYERKEGDERIGTLPKENFNGFYVMASYLLFGGKQVYNAREGEFTHSDPGRKWGDIELALRYDYADFNSRFDGVMGGSGEGITVGLSYYAPKNVKIMLNYGYQNYDRWANGRGRLIVGKDAQGNLTTNPFDVDPTQAKPGERFHFIGTRFQVSF